MEKHLLVFSESELRQVISETMESCLKDYVPDSRENPVHESLVTRKEACEFLGISLPTLSKLTKEKKIVGYRIGNQLKYCKAELLNSFKTA